MSRFTLLGVGAGAQNRTEAIGLQVRCSTFELRRQNWRKMMESNHQPSLAGTAFKAACAPCAPCAPSSVVGAAGIEPATSCSQSKRATAALRPDDGCCPVFPGCHVFCRPATYHGIEPPPVLPSLDKRAGIEPALSLLVAGADLRHGLAKCDPTQAHQSAHSPTSKRAGVFIPTANHLLIRIAA